MKKALPLALFACFPAAFPARAYAQTDRIAGAIDPARTVVLRGNVPAAARPENDIGSTDPGRILRHISIRFKPGPRQQADLDKLLADQQNPSSPLFHAWLTPEQFGDRFGLSPGDLAAVVAWLRNAGFTISGTAAARNWVAVDGSVETVQRAFHTEIHDYIVVGETHFANVSEPSLPAAVAPLVTAVEGLNDFRMTHRTRRPYTAARESPETTLTNGTHYLAPDDLATIYDIRPLYDLGFDGTGQTLVIVGESEITLSDITGFRSAFGLPAINLQQILVPGTTVGHVAEAEGEADLDLEWGGAVARNATIVYVYSPSSLTSWEYTISPPAGTPPPGPVVSASFGSCEAQAGGANLATLQTVVNQANAEGITLIAASGDSGPAGCDTQGAAPLATGGESVHIPASVPGVTGVGGTQFNEGSVTVWGTGNSTTLASALDYIPETAWNASGATGLAASGGGISSYYAKPSWQNVPGVPAGNFRAVPDVALASAAVHDAYIWFSSTEANCTPSAGGCPQGGTSAATPVFAGIVTILNQYAAAKGFASGFGLGNINPALYKLYGTAPDAFHDIVSGNNIVNCQIGTPSCTSGSYGYSAGPGYDPVTGLGSVDAYNLITQWFGAPVNPPGASAVVASITPDPVQQQAADAAGNTWLYTVTLTETAGTATTLTNFSVGSVDQSAQISSFFRSASIPANGTITAPMGGKGITPPAALRFVFGGADAGGRKWTQQTALNLAGPPAASAPAINAGGVVPLFSSVNTIEPGEWISLYGSNLVPVSAVWNGNFQTATSLGGVSVTIDGRPAYISSVTKGTPPNPDQINAEAPDDTATGPVVVTVSNSFGNVGSTVTLASFAPSFSLLDNKHVAGIILTPGGAGAYDNGAYDIVGPVGAFPYPTRPVKAGETLLLYGVGFGPANPLVPAGVYFTGAAPAANTITMTIGGVSVPLGFAGISYTGQYQFNLVMPSVPSGDQPIVATVGGVQSPANFVVTAQ